MLELRFRIRQPDGWAASVTGSARAVHVSGDNEHCLGIFRAETQEDIDRILEAHHDLIQPEQVIERSPGWLVARCNCAISGGGLNLINDMGCTVVWPITAEHGWKRYTVIAPTRTRASALVERMRELGEVEVEKVAPVDGSELEATIPLSTVTRNMTDRQLEALRVAIERGYFETPREASTEDLAKHLDVSRTTYQEHLRKATNVVMESFARILTQHPALLQSPTKEPHHPPTDTPALGKARASATEPPEST